MRIDTSVTAIAAVQAARNEQQALAEGSLLGERRISVARIALAAMLSLVTDVPRLFGHRPETPLSSVVAAAYVGVAVALFVLMRSRRSSAHRSTWHAPVMTLVDFGFVTVLALLDHDEDALAMFPIACAILVAFTVARYNLWHVALAVVCAECAYAGVHLYAGALDPHPLSFAIGGYAVLGVVVGITNRAVRVMFGDLRRRENLTRFLPNQVADRIMASGAEALVPVQREITILFSDIRGFTSLSEKLEPKAVLALLDEYFGRMTQIVKGHDGVVGKFIGDGLMAFWGVPDHVDDHALRAVRAARDMQVALRELNTEAAEHGRPPLKIGIGIHTGVVAAGLLGGAQAEYTVIGDAVNVASRVEGLTKEHAVDILVTETTWTQLGAAARGRHVAAQAIRGRAAPVSLYAIE